MKASRGLKIWSSVFKLNDNVESISMLQYYEKSEWLLIGMARTLDGTWLYIFVEYCEDKYPNTGIVQIALTEEDIDEKFHEVRKVNCK